MITTFPNLGDLNIVYILVRNWANRFFPVVPYKRLVITESEVFKVHQEIAESNKRFDDTVSLRGFIKPDVETHPLSKFGSEEVRSVEMVVTVPHLLDVGLATQDDVTREVVLICATGDRFTYSGFEYDVLEVRRGHMWANTDIPVDFLFRAERFRPDADSYAGRDDAVEEWPIRARG